MPKPMTHFVTRDTAKNKARVLKPRGIPHIKTAESQPLNLWPSGRGTQIGHFRSKFTTLIRLLSSRIPKGTTAERFGKLGDDFREVVLYGFAGETAVTLFTEPSQAPDVVAVVADVSADHEKLLQALQILFGTNITVIADPPEANGRADLA